MESRIRAAKQLEEKVSSQAGLAQAKEDAQNDFQKLISETVKRMGDSINWKEYVLNRVVLEAIVEEARNWFEQASRRTDADAETFRAQLAELKQQIETEMARFHAEREKQLEQERQERERLERIRAAEEEQRRKREEELRRAAREAMLRKWQALRERLAVLTCHITAEEFAFLKQHEKEV